MAISFLQVQNSLYEWASANVPSLMPVVWYYPNAPRPTVDYVSLQIASVQQVGWDYTPRPNDPTADVEQVGDRQFTLTINAYGGDVFTVLENLRTSLQKDVVLDTLRSSGIVFFNWHDINDITDLIDSRFEKRATMDINFRIAQTYIDNNGMIQQVELQETFLNVDSNVVYDETFLIPPIL